MGQDKALLSCGGRPLVAQALSVLRDAGLQSAIAGAKSSLADFAPVVQDSTPDRGPLGGICAALASTSARWLVFLPVDLPLLPSSLVAYLLHHARITENAVTVSSVSSFAQTFPVVLERSVLPTLVSELSAGRGGCFATFQAAAARLGQPVSVVAAELLVQAGQVDHPQGLPPVRWFLNVNTEGDLLQANRNRVSWTH